MYTPSITVLLLLCSQAAAQAPQAVRIGLFGPGTPPTYAFPTGSLPNAEYSMCTGHTDPITGREFAIAAADNGILLVDAIPPAFAADDLTGVQLDTWFFADTPSSRWRGVASYRDYVYAVSFMHAGIRRFHIDTSLPRAQWVTDLGYDATTMTQLARSGPRSRVDHQHGLLYIVGIDPVTALGKLAVYDLFDETTQTVIDPPSLLAEWTPGGLIFDVCLLGDRAYASYQTLASAGGWRILDVSSLWTNPPATPTAWNPPYTEWTSTAVPHPLSHDSYVAPDGRTWFTVDEGQFNEGHMLARDLGPIPPVLNNGTMPEPPVVGAYNLVPFNPIPEPMHSLRGIGHTGYVSHWSAGLHVIDLSINPGGFNEYPLVAAFDTSSMPPSVTIGDGAWDCYPHQDSGVVYVNDSEEGLSLVRLDVGQVNRYGPGTANGVSVPRIVGNLRPPRIGFAYDIEIEQMLPLGLGALVLGVAEDPNYLNHTPLSLLGATILVDLNGAFVGLALADANGSMTTSTNIPNLPALVGWKIFAQALELVGGSSLAASRGTWFGIAQ